MTFEAEFPVVALVPPSVPSPEESALARLLRGTPRSNVGRGLIRPFSRDGKRDFLNATSVELMESMIVQILGTRATSAVAMGELPWRPEFGSWLYLLRHANNDDVLEDLARSYVVDALGRWLPRAEITSVKIEPRREVQDLDTLFILVGFQTIKTRDGRADLRFAGTARVPIPRAA